MIDNPYKRTGSIARELKKVSADVDPRDYAFCKKMFPSGCTGITDKIISTLYKKFIDELRRLESDPNISFELSYYRDSPGYVLLDVILGDVQFGQHVGRESGSDDSGGTPGVHQEVRVDAVVGAVAESSDSVGRGIVGRDKEKKNRRTKKG